MIFDIYNLFVICNVKFINFLAFVKNDGGYSSAVRTLGCGPRNEGSTPSSHPTTKNGRSIARFYFWSFKVFFSALTASNSSTSIFSSFSNA